MSRVAMGTTVFSNLTDDVVLKIFSKLDDEGDDPRSLARLASVCSRFSSLICHVCWRKKCLRTIPSVAADLVPSAAVDPPGGWSSLHKLAVCCPGLLHSGVEIRPDPPQAQPPAAGSGEARNGVVSGSHLASGVWSLSREQGNKLLASRFRSDVLYICDWPGCVHTEEKRNYMLFRGVFKDFKRSRVWRTISDGDRSRRVGVNCAFCSCNVTWDLHSAFCLRRFFGFHEDGELVVRAFVCENGHVSGAWTALPLYT